MLLRPAFRMIRIAVVETVPEELKVCLAPAIEGLWISDLDMTCSTLFGLCNFIVI
jgi:hypothetical protein